MPATMTRRSIGYVRACPSLRLMALLVGWRPDAEEALRSARAAGADICSILFRSADAHLAAIGYTREEARSRVGHLAQVARQEGFETVIYGPSFASQADPGYLLDMYAAAVQSDVDVVSFADSLGVMKPAAVGAVVVESEMSLATRRSACTCTTTTDWHSPTRWRDSQLARTGRKSACSVLASGPETAHSRS